MTALSSLVRYIEVSRGICSHRDTLDPSLSIRPSCVPCATINPLIPSHSFPSSDLSSPGSLRASIFLFLPSDFHSFLLFIFFPVLVSQSLLLTSRMSLNISSFFIFSLVGVLLLYFVSHSSFPPFFFSFFWSCFPSLIH